MSTEPQSRVPLDGPSNGLVTQFDLHLKVIADRYLGFFLERSVSHDLQLSLIPTLFFSQTEDRRGLVSRGPRDMNRCVLADSLSQSIDSLWKLHHKATAIDNYYDARIEPDTSRAAWNEVRDNVERGTPTQPTAIFEVHICSRDSSSTGILEHADDRHHKSSYCTKG